MLYQQFQETSHLVASSGLFKNFTADNFLFLSITLYFESEGYNTTKSCSPGK